MTSLIDIRVDLNVRSSGDKTPLIEMNAVDTNLQTEPMAEGQTENERREVQQQTAARVRHPHPEILDAARLPLLFWLYSLCTQSLLESQVYPRLRNVSCFLYDFTSTLYYVCSWVPRIAYGWDYINFEGCILRIYVFLLL